MGLFSKAESRMQVDVFLKLEHISRTHCWSSRPSLPRNAALRVLAPLNCMQRVAAGCRHRPVLSSLPSCHLDIHAALSIIDPSLYDSEEGFLCPGKAALKGAGQRQEGGWEKDTHERDE